MGECKAYLKSSKMLFVVLLSVVCLTGCHGDIGWDRLQTPIGSQNKGGLGQSQQVDIGLEDADPAAERDA